MSSLKDNLLFKVFIFFTAGLSFFWTTKAANNLIDLQSDANALMVVSTQLILFILYFLTIENTSWGKVKLNSIILIVLTLNVLFLFSNYLTSNDLFSYITSTRVFGKWGENPYLVSFSNFQQDEFYGKINTVWSDKTSLYGPLFILLGGLLNIVGQNNLLLTVLIFKLFFAVLNILNVSLVYKITKSVKNTFIYALNPLVVFELYGNRHIESFLIFAILVSVYYIKVKKTNLSFLALSGATLIKYSPAIFYPFAVIYFYKNISTFKKFLKKIIIAAITSGVFIVLIYLPFWEGVKIFSYLDTYYKGQYISPSILILIGDSIFSSYSFSFRINTILFVLVYIYMLLKFAFSKAKFADYTKSILILYLFYMLTKLSLVMVWYLVPLIAFASLNIRSRKLNYFICAFVCFYSLMLYWFVR